MHLQVTSVMCVPLLEQGNVLGIIYVGNDNVVNLFDQQALDLLTVFAAQASLIIQRALLVDSLKLESEALKKELAERRFGVTAVAIHHRVGRLEIGDALSRGREDFVYRLTVGELPLIESVFPLGATAGGDAFVGIIASTGDEDGDAANVGGTFRDITTDLAVPTGEVVVHAPTGVAEERWMPVFM